MSDLSPDEVLDIVRRESPLAEKTLAGLRRAFSEFYLRYSGYEPLEVRQVRIGQAEAYWVRSEGASKERTLLFFHGGGFTIGSSQDHMDLCARLSATAKARVLSLDYRLAPEYPFPAAFEDSLAAFKWLLEQNLPPAGLGLVGISAGGNLVLTTLLSLRDADLPLPAAAVCMSPATDLRFPGDTARQNRPSDWITRGRLDVILTNYLKGQDPTQPLVSPIFGDLDGLPPMLVQVGGGELLYDDVLAFVTKAKAAGVDIHLDEYPGLFHCWQVFGHILAQGRLAIQKAGDFLAARLDA